jgi:hypothetical protein
VRKVRGGVSGSARSAPIGLAWRGSIALHRIVKVLAVMNIDTALGSSD